MKYLIISVVVLLSLFLVVGIIYLPKYFPVAEISCNSLNSPCSEELQSKIKDLKGKNWQTVRTKVVSLVDNDPEIKEYSIRFKLPNTMEVYLVENKALYAIHFPENNIFYLINNQGTIIKITGENNLPYIDYSDKLPNVGEKIDEKLIFALQTVSPIYYSYQVKSAIVANGNLNIILSSGLTVIFPLEGDQKALLGSFKLIIDHLEMNKLDNADNLGKISVVDLRFKNPVLK